MAQPPIPERLERDQWTAEDIHSTDQHGNHRYWRVFVQLRDGGRTLPIAPEYLAPGAALPPGAHAQIDVQTGIVQADGRRTANSTEPTIVREGKNLGRRNATNALSQAVAEARSRYRKQLKSTAPRLRAESKSAATAAIASLAGAAGPGGGDPAVAPGPRPVMLARNLEEKFPPLADFCADAGGAPCAFVLRKFDGVRAGVFLKEKAGAGARRVEPVFFGRRLDLQERRADMYGFLRPYFDTARRLGWNAAFGPMFLDGEIYRHGWSRQTIVGKEHRQDEQRAAEADLDYYVFLVRFPLTDAGRALPIRELLEMRRRLFEETPAQLAGGRPRVVGAEFFPVVDEELCDERGRPRALDRAGAEAARARITRTLEGFMARFLREGYEGAVLYRGCAPYEESTESHRKGTLLRLKPVHEEEFEVAGFEADKRGKAEGAIKWVVLTPALRPGRPLPPAAERKAFRTTFKDMTLEDRKRWFREMRETDSSGQSAFDRLYKGRPLSIAFRDYTDDGVPMHAWATGFRDKNEM